MDNLKTNFNKIIKEHGLKIIIVIAIIIILLLINYLLKFKNQNIPKTTRNLFGIVMEPGKKFPTKVVVESTNLITSFAEKCAKGDYEAAYDLLSYDVKQEVFNTLEEFTEYAKVNFPKNSRYEVIPYSKVGTLYIYQVKVFEDFLATGASFNDISYIDLKMAINETIEGEKLLSIAGFMGKFKLNSMFENDYLKVKLNSKLAFYSEEIYNVTLINRTEHEIVIRDFKAETEEILLNNSSDYRVEIKQNDNIILKPYEEKEIEFAFPRFFDEKAIANSIMLTSIRVVREGKGEDYTDKDILAKFSSEIVIEK